MSRTKAASAHPISQPASAANTGRVVFGRRRFTCLSPTLVRIEFAPDGVFEERRSLVAYPVQQPQPFTAVTRDGAWDVLDTGALQIRTCRNEATCNRLNLEVRWSDGRLMQFWRPGDRDHQNLGGTLRSLDRYGGECCVLDGVHPAVTESSDVSAANWPAWIQCEVDPLYQELHPNPPEGFNRGHWLREAQRSRNDGRFLERTFNWYKDARKFTPGVLSASGYYLLNDSDGAMLDGDDFPVERERPGYQDWYFFGYGRNYLQALADFRLLSGPAPLPPRKSLGIIFSRWPAFTEAEIEAMARDFAASGYPLSTLVMDMEWHREGWGHWEFNPELIPDPARFFARCRELGLDVTFNDHPLDVRDDDVHFAEYVRRAGPEVEVRPREYNHKHVQMAKVDVCDKQQNRAFCDTCHRAIMELGLDYWWNDGSRGQMAGTNGQLVCNKTFFEESERDGRRGMLLARYGGFGSHRYGAFFTGDANSDYDVLRLQCEFNIRAAGVGISQVSHDIGGFMLPRSQVQKNAQGEEIVDPERYLRWLQFGVFGPILRFHSAPGCGSRKPYDYDTELGGACRHWLRVRHSLLPYIYTAADTHRDSGLPLVRGLYLEDPDNPAAYRFDQYLFGPAILVAPVLTPEHERTFYLPPGLWWEFGTATQVTGGREITRDVARDEVAVYVRAGRIIPRQDPDGEIHAGHVARLWLDVYPPVAATDGQPTAATSALLYEDDGRSTRYRQGEFCRSRFDLQRTDGGAGRGRTVISGRVQEGCPLGAVREVTVELPLTRLPRQATLAGRSLSVALCGNGRYRIRIPELPAAQPWEMIVEE